MGSKSNNNDKTEEQSLEDSFKQVESLAEPLAIEIAKIGKNSVALPSMPREAKIMSILKGKEHAKIRFIVKGEEEDDPEVPILQPYYKCEGIDAEGRTVEITMKLNLKKGDNVLIAYKSGKLGNPVIIGKLPKE